MTKIKSYMLCETLRLFPSFEPIKMCHSFLLKKKLSDAFSPCCKWLCQNEEKVTDQIRGCCFLPWRTVQPLFLFVFKLLMCFGHTPERLQTQCHCLWKTQWWPPWFFFLAEAAAVHFHTIAAQSNWLGWFPVAVSCLSPYLVLQTRINIQTLVIE